MRFLAAQHRNVSRPDGSEALFYSKAELKLHPAWMNDQKKREISHKKKEETDQCVVEFS